MAADDDYGDFNPENDNHQELVVAVADYLADKGWVSTPDVVETTHSTIGADQGWSRGYLRGLLTYARQWMDEEDIIDTKKEEEGGQPTWYWRHADGE